ncbi:MAG: hypothetical protein ACRBCT_09090 [Alphaproteobacteria bacterium]
MPYTFAPFQHASPLQHYVYSEQSEFDKALIRNFAVEYEKGTQNTNDGRPQIGTLRAIAPIICMFRYKFQKGEGDYQSYWVRYSKNRSYVSAHNTGYTARVNGVIKHLERLGYLEHRPARRNAELQSRFQFKPSFRDILEELKPQNSEDPLIKDPDYKGVPWRPEHEIFVKPWVRREYNGRNRSRNDIRRERVSINRSDAYKSGIADDLRKHNDFIEQFAITLDAAHLSALEQKVAYETFQERYPFINRTTRSFRLFIDEGLTKYGRFHGAWWQFLNSSLRPFLLIDGQRTVELDYGGLQPNILMSLNQVDVGDNFDPYLIANRNRQEGEDEYHYRPLVKKCFMFIANGKTPERYLTSVKANLTREINETPEEERSGDSYQKKVELRTLLDSGDYSDRFRADLQHAWSGMWDDFQEEAYLWRYLTIKETQITNNIHNRMREQSIPVLSIHDSYIVPDTYELLLKDMMIEEFQRVLNVNRIPLIKLEGEGGDIEDSLEVIDEDDYGTGILRT